ncbi:MAG: YkgJ family cysteine cluster protein [Candidatus Methanofastidiosia archaeon]
MKEKLVPYTGQKYECRMCGECCHCRSVPLTKGDMERISRLSKKNDFTEYYVNMNKFVLSRREWDAGCIFLDDKKCTIHRYKPLVCRLFPFAIVPQTAEKNKKEMYKMPDGTKTCIYVDTSCPGVSKKETKDMPKWLIPLIQRTRIEMALTRFYYEDKEIDSY